jgi:hypothetical protein
MPGNRPTPIVKRNEPQAPLMLSSNMMPSGIDMGSGKVGPTQSLGLMKTNLNRGVDMSLRESLSGDSRPGI